MSKFACWFVKLTGWLPYWICFRPKYYYEDKKSQGRKIKGSAIIMPRHTSIWDFVTIMFLFPGRNIRCAVAEVIYQKGPVLSWLLNKIGAIRVERKSSDFAFIDKACSVLENGNVFEIYPEARLPLPEEETPLPFKPSAAYIAIKSGAPIIPVVTNGQYFQKRRLRVMVGKRIDISGIYDSRLSEKENIENISKALRESVIELSKKFEEVIDKK